MKLTFVTQNEAPFRMRWMDELARYMDVQVFHLGRYETHTDMKYIDYHTIRAKTDQIAKRTGCYNYKRIIQSGYDILMLDGYGCMAQQLLALRLILSGRAYGLTVDGGFVPEKEHVMKAAVKKIIISNARFVFSTGKAIDRYLMHYGAKKCGIHRHQFSNIMEQDILKRPLDQAEKAALRKELGIADRFTIVSAGKFIYRKGFDLLVRAVKNMEDSGKAFQVLLIGAPEKYREKMSRRSRIQLLPFMEKELLWKYYQASDLFVLPTRGDIWGLVTGEAMACGLPVITTDRCLSGLEMIRNGENGCIIPVENVEALQKSMTELMGRDLYRMGVKSLKTAARYCVEQAAVRDMEFLSCIIKQAGNSGQSGKG